VAVPEIFNTLEQSGMSKWIRESESVFGFYFILLFHNFGLAMLIGSSVIIDLRILGFAPDVPLKSLNRLFSIMWIGLVINAITGVLLLIGYPTKALTNPMFYIKLSIIAVALVTMWKIKTRVFDNINLSELDMIATGKSLAKWSLLLWFMAITAGRLLAYTYTYLYYGIRE
jgi:hypothetical protein